MASVGFTCRQDLSKKGDPILVADDALGFDADTKFNAEQEVAAAYVELNIPFVTSTMNAVVTTSISHSRGVTSTSRERHQSVDEITSQSKS